MQNPVLPPNFQAPPSPLAGFQAQFPNMPVPMPDLHPEPSETQDPNKSGMIDRDLEAPSPEISAQIKKLCEAVRQAKVFHADAFKKMRDNQRFASGKQWRDQGAVDNENYQANIIQRHIKQTVASLYAKNPKAICKRRQTLDFKIWDETAESYQQAVSQVQLAAQHGLPPDPMSQALLQDIQQGFQRRQMIDKVARTLEIVFAHYQKNLEPGFKLQMKKLVRRTLTNSVGYVKLGFQRLFTKRPEDVEKVTDITQQLAKLERLLADKLDNEYTETDARYAELKQQLQELNETENDHIAKEGLVFDFPRSTSIIIDPRCTDLRTFLGAQWVAQEYILSPDDIKEIYKKDVGKNYQQYKPDLANSVLHSPTTRQPDELNSTKCVVWEIYSKTDNMKYVVCDGYDHFLEEPENPPLNLERFWPFFVLTFNDTEDENQLYPQSDVELLMPMQKEYNRSRQALREHRVANRPAYAITRGVLDEHDIGQLTNRPDNAVLQLNGLSPGQKIEEVLQAIKPAPIDPAIYDTAPILDDTYKVVGGQEANFGGTNTATATQSNIAESSRSATISSNVDDLDDLLTELARASGQVLLLNLSLETVQRIAGPGAVWPQASAQDIADELALEIQAGSSGRPNKAAEIANFQQIAPTLLQIPNINPIWLAKEALKRMDDSMDVTEAIQAGAQSIIAQNAQKQLAMSSNPAEDPNAQGAKGGQNKSEHMNQPPPPPGPPDMGRMAG